MRNRFGCNLVTLILWFTAGLALFLFGWNLRSGPETFNLARVQIAGIDLSLSIRIDSLSTIVFLLVSFIALCVGQYSLRYLDGERRQWYFYRYLLATYLAVSTLVLSSNLVMFFAAWLGISWGLHHLLLFNKDRLGAIYAARKKVLVSRLGDVAVLAGIALLYKTCKSFEFNEIFSLAYSASIQQSADLSLAGLFLVIGAMAKSAQVPFHFWLPDTMETPTPVSALMHAGVINAGGILILRLSPVIEHAGFASFLLGTLGAVTAVYASLVMATQTDIKRKLAYSTISQMGMMMFACGIGAYTLALFHIIAHSLYKAYAFLSTGTLVEESKLRTPHVKPLPIFGRTMGILIGAAIVGIGTYWKEGAYISVFTYSAVLLLGFFQNMPTRKFALHKPLHFKIATTLMLATALGIFIGIEASLIQFLNSELVQITTHTIPAWQFYGTNFVAYFIFAVGFWFSNSLINPHTRFQKKLYVLFWNDSYFGIKTTKLIHQYWPLSV